MIARYLAKSATLDRVIDEYYRRRLKTLKKTNRAFVLMYHRVLKSKTSEPGYVEPGMWVSADTFERQVNRLASKFDVLPLAEIVERLKAGHPVGGCCAITSDDGWRDNFDAMFPVLERYQIPATVFLATGYIGTNRLFWPEELTFSLSQNGFHQIAETVSEFDAGIEQLLTSDTNAKVYEKLIDIFKRLPPNTREDILEKIRSCSPQTQNLRLMMNWEEAGKMQASGLVSFGAHTRNHEILTQVSDRSAENEIARSCDDIEENLAVRPTLFAYPNGNCTGRLKALLNKYGLSAAVTTRRGWIGEATPLLELPRVGMHEDISCKESLFYARIFSNRSA